MSNTIQNHLMKIVAICALVSGVSFFHNDQEIVGSMLLGLYTAMTWRNAT